jgi:hypothetical protein
METNFDCGRTCRRWELCKFTPVLSRLGHTRVYSHTVKTEVEFRDQDALRKTVERLGGTILGEGKHSLFAGPQHGFGFRLPGWQYPLVAQGGGLFFDDYHGQWGDVADLDTLRAGYTIEAARNAAQAQGWMHQDASDGSLVIYHPDQGTLTVHPDGKVEAAGFVGSGCADAGAVIERAIGRTVETTNKAEFYAENAEVTQDE